MIKFYDESKTREENKKQQEKQDHNASTWRLATSVMMCASSAIVLGTQIYNKVKK